MRICEPLSFIAITPEHLILIRYGEKSKRKCKKKIFVSERDKDKLCGTTLIAAGKDGHSNASAKNCLMLAL